MAASVNDKFRKARSSGRPQPAYLTAPLLSGGTTASVSTTTGWATDTGTDFIIFSKNPATNEEIAGTRTTWRTTVSGTNLNDLALEAGTVPVGGYPAGEQSVVIATPTAAWNDDLIDGLLVSHDQDGTLAAGAVDNAAVLATDVVETAKVKDGAITASKLATSAITIGYASITSSFSTSSATPVQVTGLSISVTVPAGGRRIKVTAWARALFNTTANAQIIMTVWDGTVGSGTQISESYAQSNGANTGSNGTAIAILSPAAGAKTYNVGLHQSGGGTANLQASTSFPGFILAEVI